jgi:uncharacterized protein YndB with AHSA1/START domain
METQKICETVEINAPLEEVFRLVTSEERRLQLRQDWGTEKYAEFSADFPRSGSRFRARPVDESRAPYDTVVTDWLPNRTFAYHSEDARQSAAQWRLEPAGENTRLTYEETYIPLDVDGEEEQAVLAQEARQWLGDIKRYLELPNSRVGRTLKWVLDTIFLKQRADQRRIILTLVAIQMISIFTFTMAALGLGLARLLFF